MTGVTHQMAALLVAFWILTIYPVSLGWMVGVLAVISVMIGALTPDLDQPTANIWRRMLGGNTIGNIFQFFFGGHRHITHSLVGIGLIGCALRAVILHFVHPDYVTAGLTLWAAFMIGYISHPIADTFTDQGVPWFWPLHIRIRIPPGPEEVRVTTGSWVEVLLVQGGILVCGCVLAYSYWPVVTRMFG